jgi:hypothetical protein
MNVRFLLIIFCFIPCALYAQTSIRFAVIGDFGKAGQAELDVSTLVKSWNPDFIITTGDNNYEVGSASTIDTNIGYYYHEFIYPYTGIYGDGAAENKFFPSLGNHDWGNAYPNPDGADPYLNYFTLPNNERYYDFVKGPVHFFAIDSDPNEPDGRTSSSVQAQWLQTQLSASTSQWKIVYFHHPPYSSGQHGSQAVMRWQFKEWGASAVIAGHDHTYERLLVNNLPYFVNGLGGKSIYTFGTILPESQFRYNGNYGAMLVEANEDSIVFKFFNRSNALIDSYSLVVPPTIPSQVTLVYPPDSSAGLPNTIEFKWNTAAFAEVYQFEISTSYSFDSLVVVDSTLTDTTYSVSTLNPFDEHFWRVRAVNGAGTGSYSDVWQFRQYVPNFFSGNVNHGWNLVSIPVEAETLWKSFLFPTSTSGAFAFEGTYVEHETLSTGIGYWLKFDGAQSLSFRGLPRTADTIEVVEGWNLIGTLSDSVPVESIITLPDNILASQFYGYEQGYFSVNILLPLKGYWIKVSSVGQLILISTEAQRRR